MLVRTFPTGTPIKRFPKQVAFGEDDTVVVGGSDHGVIYVFDRKTGDVLDTIIHSRRGLVQTVTVRRFVDKLANTNGLPDTCERWYKHYCERRFESRRRRGHSSMEAKTAHITGETEQQIFLRNVSCNVVATIDDISLDCFPTPKYGQFKILKISDK